MFSSTNWDKPGPASSGSFSDQNEFKEIYTATNQLSFYKIMQTYFNVPWINYAFDTNTKQKQKDRNRLLLRVRSACTPRRKRRGSWAAFNWPVQLCCAVLVSSWRGLWLWFSSLWWIFYLSLCCVGLTPCSTWKEYKLLILSQKT